MNGSVYISFFQGQLEPVLEQVVQLAVQEISKTVGSSLNSMLLETAVKEQENQQLKLRLRSRDGALDGGRPVPPAGRRAAGAAAADGACGGGTKLEPPEDSHAPVASLKGVMERVLDFAVRELTKIVEASFDDLLLEITKKEREQKALEEHLGRSVALGGGGGGPGNRGGRVAGHRRGSEHDSTSPSGSEDTREEPGDAIVSKETPEADCELNNADQPAMLSMSQDWVPILDKVFGQKLCSDVWRVKELEVSGGKAPGEGLSWGPGSGRAHFDLVPVDMKPSPTSPQQDPRWTPLEEMEVLSPGDDGSVKGHDRAASPSESLRRRSSASMLQRLLTLPAQLMEEEEDDGGEAPSSTSVTAAAADTLETMAAEGIAVGVRVGGHNGELRGVSSLATKWGEQQQQQQQQQQVVAVVALVEEEEEEEDKGRKKRRRVWLECDECGRRFSRASQLKTHRQTHAADEASAAAGERSPSPTGGEDDRPSPSLTVLRCSECRKHFSSASRLQSHVQNQHQHHSSGKQS
ncbi:hypothetical protein CRUP_006519 [Coryphaenoides rupestris]|nr:hypothetical protein CRUP_006519 [Coryphaenoides rupestris]